MSRERRGAVRPLTGSMRRLLLFLSALAAIAGSDLYLATESTERYFAWTIRSPLTAASLGAAYLSSVVLLVLSARAADWAGARLGAFSAQVLIALILVAMLVHIDLFHTGSSDAITFFATWSFIGTYVVVPPLVLAGLVHQLRVPGADPHRGRRLPGPFRLLLALQGALLVLLGAALVLAPSRADALWPWSLTPLTARAVGAFLVAIGLGLAIGAREDEWRRIAPGTVAYAVLAVLELVALLRYTDEPDWGSVSIWVYVAFLGVTLAVGVYGSLRARPRDRSRARPELSGPRSPGPAG